MNKKIAMTALGLSVFSSIGLINVIDSNAWGSTSSDYDYRNKTVWSKNESNLINGRYQEGSFWQSPTMPSNPVGGETIDGNETYQKTYGQKIKTAMKSGYGYDILYYEPYANGSGRWYTSPQADGVDENYYSKFNPYYNLMHSISWGGSSSNFARVDGQPNAGAKSSYPISGYYVTNSSDKRFGLTGQWRWLGYSVEGQALSNPFFPADVGAYTGHRSDCGILNQDIHYQYTSNQAKQYEDLSEFDEPFFYTIKLNAIKNLMNSDTKFKTGTIKQVNRSSGTEVTVVNNGSISAELWANSLSLKTNPLLETPLFQGHREAGSRYVDVVGVTDDRLLSELSIQSVIVRDTSGNLIKRFDRDSNGNTTTTGSGSVSAGQQIKIQYVIKNTGKGTTTVNPGKVQAGVAYGSNAYNNDYASKYSSNQSNWTIQGGGKISPNSSITLEQTITVDSNATDVFRVTGYMHEDYIKAGESGVTSNDWGHVLINVKKGDTGLSNIQLIDKSGNVVKYMKPGEEYKTRYTFKYTGPNIRFQDYYLNSEWCSHSDPTKSHWTYTKVYYDVWKDFTFSWTATRYLPGGGSEIYRDSDTVSVNTLKNGTTWTYETPYFVYEVPKASASASMTAPTEGTDSDPSNNSGSKDWEYKYDIIVSNVRVYNKNERPTQDGYITLGLKYDVELVTPTEFPYFETDVKTHVTLPNGNVLEFTDHLKQGKNPDITREIQVPVSVITSGSKNLNVQVFANADKKFWETDLATQSNNKGSNSTVQLPPVNPNTSKGCSIVKNTNSFSVTHSINNYNGSLIKWSKFNNSATYSFYKYNNGTKSTSTKTYNESYKINYVKFKSKDTVDNKYGTNGWVDLTKSSEKDKAIIKAGYGYELAIEVEYKTDALANQPKAYSTRTTSSSYGTTVTNLNNKANVYKDIYVRTSDGKTLSATGMYGTISAFDVTTVTSNENTTVLRYTMKNTTQNGVTTPVKIYTSENATDGSYGLTVWTPTITGVGNPQKADTSLCDEKGVSYTIKGSMYDDNQDSIIQ